MERKYLYQTTALKRTIKGQKEVQNVYDGIVVSIKDSTDGGRIRVRVIDLDKDIIDGELRYAYPLLPKFLHQMPIEGELVRILIPDINKPQSGRLWTGSVISQPHKISYDNNITATSTTNLNFVNPDKAPSTYPEAKGIYPNPRDIGLIGRNNTDIILSELNSESSVELRAGKHILNNNLKLNNLNPATIKIVYEPRTGTTPTISTNLIMADRIAIISHNGIPKFKAAQLDSKDRDRIFNEGHPLGRGDVIVEAFEVLRNAMINHIHNGNAVPPNKSGSVVDLEKIDFNQILQKNIVIN